MRTLIIILALLLLTGCIPESDNVKITRDLITMKETATANTAAIKALTARVDALTTEMLT